MSRREMDEEPRARRTEHAWWRDAVVYQVYPRSFADGNGDGSGDLAGIRLRLGYLVDLGVDAIWLNPWYPSPMADAGYDVSDYRDIDPAYGALADADALLAEAHAAALRVIIDLVPNHCSSEHPWFREAVAAGPGSPLRERFWFRPGRGRSGELAPTDWPSYFGGPAWTRLPDGDWYLHLFAPEQPDFNWSNPDVRTEFLDVLRFWFDRGVDGIRVDTAHSIVKDASLPDVGRTPDLLRTPFRDQPGVHEIYRSWRAVADCYADRVFVGEVWLPTPEQVARYVRPDELHTVFNIDYLSTAWEAAPLRRVVDTALQVSDLAGGAPPVWALANHDVTRTVTRYGRARTWFSLFDRRHGEPCDVDLGRRRARAAALLTLALPGSAYVYQGEELGLEEVEDLPDSARQDPIFRRTGGRDRGRDGCRVPLPWSGSAPPFGFSPDGNNPDLAPAPATQRPDAGSGSGTWLPQPARWAAWTVQAQSHDAGSMLALYRDALRLRRALARDADGFRWLDADADVLAFDRAGGWQCWVNLGRVDRPLPPGEVVLASLPGIGAVLPPDAAVWVRVAQAQPSGWRA